MKVEKQIKKVEEVVTVEKLVYVLEMSELELMRLRELIGCLSITTYNSIIEDKSLSLNLNDGDWLYHSFKMLNNGLEQQ